MIPREKRIRSSSSMTAWIALALLVGLARANSIVERGEPGTFSTTDPTSTFQHINLSKIKTKKPNANGCLKNPPEKKSPTVLCFATHTK